MSPDQKIKLLHDICDRNPHMRIQNALWRVRKAEKAEDLQRPVNKQRGVVAMIRKIIHREGV